MLFKKEIRKLLLELTFLSLGGFLLHYRLHPVPLGSNGAQNPADFLPFSWDIAGILAVPFLLNYRASVLVGYLVNGVGVVVGAITMSTFSLSTLTHPVTFSVIVLDTTLPLILILFAKLFIGQIVLQHFYPGGMGRLFTPFYWTRHFFYLAVVFALGHFLWR
jgi:hypothetical protein